MTTDITELAQSLKAAAEKATPGPWRRSSVRFNGITDIANPMEQGSKPHVANASEKRDAEFIALANPSNILALVEALEKAQAKIIELQQGCENDPRTHEIIDLQERIAELESRTVTAAAADVLAERQRQVTAEGWTAERDDGYQNSELADAAACYAIHAHNQGFSTPAHWPWSQDWWKQTSPRRDLVKAGALILAEIERLDRASGIKVEAE
ncbi:ead/Ea22-like family protein [Raoultella planticola]|uniref:ead/Ea22-like family protein n=1 Tax=Raoultella planticola TaxID=575 RepID=UPI00241688A8|nr:ead/Ea22-like family protein [Raoultella planticola]EJR0225597.1 ead/Ea22-like family protein [Raoultella planticola]EJR0354727.1 ead/Ea22-like family protein [Raoultella planticola]MDV1446324.1 ead/Ea22-like family protein [Raoultella planticola]MDV1565287.1 ead/Ea22-like family protein [Raoultella planticola]MDV1572509.1 ead/Ea22-like family protein [Raoultella planticola]